MKVFSVFLLMLCTSGAFAQHMHPYAGQEKREIKALSSDEVSGYLAGAGMGYAKAAELNGYPGPMHVLELADQLHLTAGQRQAVKRLMDEHKARARALGADVVESEKAIETLFRSGHVDEPTLAKLVDESARRQGLYRLSHLDTHRKALALLTPEQVTEYSALRGYAATGHQHQ